MSTTVVVRPTETPEQAVDRLIREDWKALETPAGQALLEQLRDLAKKRRREAVR